MHRAPTWRRQQRRRWRRRWCSRRRAILRRRRGHRWGRRSRSGLRLLLRRTAGRWPCIRRGRLGDGRPSRRLNDRRTGVLRNRLTGRRPNCRRGRLTGGRTHLSRTSLSRASLGWTSLGLGRRRRLGHGRLNAGTRRRRLRRTRRCLRRPLLLLMRRRSSGPLLWRLGGRPLLLLTGRALLRRLRLTGGRRPSRRWTKCTGVGRGRRLEHAGLGWRRRRTLRLLGSRRRGRAIICCRRLRRRRPAPTTTARRRVIRVQRLVPAVMRTKFLWTGPSPARRTRATAHGRRFFEPCPRFSACLTPNGVQAPCGHEKPNMAKRWNGCLGVRSNQDRALVFV